MTSVQKISVNETKSKPFLTPKNTGYTATALLGVTTLRAFSKKKGIIKSHKILGAMTAVATLLHIGLIEYYHHKYKKM